MVKQYGSDVLASVHETALNMMEAGVMSKRTMKAFDEMCLTPVEDMTPEDIRALRLLKEAEPGKEDTAYNDVQGVAHQPDQDPRTDTELDRAGIQLPAKEHQTPISEHGKDGEMDFGL